MEFAYWRQDNEPVLGLEEHPEDEERAKQEPEFDYFEVHRSPVPKREIGGYVRNQGFNVPIIDTMKEWENAFDSGNAMLRSELDQDYDGLSGLLSSLWIRPEFHFPAEGDKGYYARFAHIILDGLRSGELPAIEYMSRLRGYISWDRARANQMEIASSLGIDFSIEEPSVSMWEYIKGTNVKMFADPNVKGRYHFGVQPPDEMYGGQDAVGSYRFDAGEYDEPKKFRKHDAPFIPRPYIEIYESIRNLPRFDNTNCPVMELQGDQDGNIHFLQYLKTGQRINYTEPYDIEASSNAIRTTNVRGITAPEGKNMRLFLSPRKLAPKMRGEGIYFGFHGPQRGLAEQFASDFAGFVLHEAYISFQDNHFNSSPMYRPPLAAGYGTLEGTSEQMLETISKIREASFEQPYISDNVLYIDVHVKSNGRELAMESDWEIKSIPYSKLR